MTDNEISPLLELDNGFLYNDHGGGFNRYLVFQVLAFRLLGQFIFHYLNVSHFNPAKNVTRGLILAYLELTTAFSMDRFLSPI